MKIRVSFCSAFLLLALASAEHLCNAAMIEPPLDSCTLVALPDADLSALSTRSHALGDVVPATGTESLARVRLANDLLYSDLQNFVCHERIDRYKGSLTGSQQHRIDTVLSKVSFENGVEHYSDIRQDNRSRSSISRISGAWSQGEFGTLLRQTEALIESGMALYRTHTKLNGTPAVLYRFEVSEHDSPWNLEVDSWQYQIPFRTDVWTSRSSGQMLKIERTSTAIPVQTRISEVRWSVSLETVQLNGKSWLLPSAGEYEVLYEESNHREWNLMSFSEYHRYGSEVTLRFDGQ